MVPLQLDAKITNIGPPVSIAEGLFAPEWFTAELTGMPGNETVRLEIRMRDGHPTCRSIHVVGPRGGQGVLPASLRAVSLQRWLDVLTYRLTAEDPQALHPKRLAADGLLGLTDEQQQHAEAVLGGRRRRMTPALFAEIAEIYLSDESGGPTQAVANHFMVSHSTAARWVGLAREAGTLPRTSPGRATPRENHEKENR